MLILRKGWQRIRSGPMEKPRPTRHAERDPYSLEDEAAGPRGLRWGLGLGLLFWLVVGGIALAVFW